MQPDVAIFVEKFDKARWSSLPLRSTPDRLGERSSAHLSQSGHLHTQSGHLQLLLQQQQQQQQQAPRGDHSERDERGPGGVIEKAGDAEVSHALGRLNFIRWLCGLQPVQVSHQRGLVCDIVAQFLLPRGSARSAEQLGAIMSFARVLDSFLSSRDGHVMVLHCEGSLVGGMEQSLSATHSTTVPVQAAVPKHNQLVKGIMRTVGYEVVTKSQEKTQSARRRSVSDVLEMLLQTKLTANGLPEPLKPLKLLWQLAPEDEGRPGGVDFRGAGGEAARSLGPPTQTGASPASARGARPPGRSWKGSTSCGASTARISGRRDSGDGFLSGGGRCSMWGDSTGSLDFRRYLLSAECSELGLARWRDTCVLWTGTCKQVHRPQAVCYPPAGIVPLALLEGWRSPWTIMPDSLRFQPTADTRVRAWRVRIERPGDGPWTADRGDEIAVVGQAVDCSNRGEPFCVLFWPDIGQVLGNEQLEVVLCGLRGPVTELTFFFDIQPLSKTKLDLGLCTEAASIRELFGTKELWDADSRPSNVIARAATQQQEAFKKRTRTKALSTVFDDTWSPDKAEISVISHQNTTIFTSDVDVDITLRSSEIAAMRTELYILRFGDEEEHVPCGTQTQKFADGFFHIRVKLPMARCRYELRISVSGHKAPHHFLQHQLTFNITSSEACQMLLASMEDPFVKCFGLAQIHTAAHLHHIVVLAPLSYRIISGQCYFLVFVNKESLLGPQEVDSPRKGQQHVATTLFSHRLLQVRHHQQHHHHHHAHKPFGPRSALAKQSSTDSLADSTIWEPRGTFRGSKLAAENVLTLTDVHAQLRPTMEPLTQDSEGEIHLDLMLHDGSCVHRLQERGDFPGFFEGLFSFGEADVLTKIRLQLRLPEKDTGRFAPRLVAEWIVSRPSHYPINF